MSNSEDQKVKIDRTKVLGRGKYATVFEGTFNGKRVAVKRAQLIDVESNPIEEETLKKLDHPNVIKLLYSESDDDFRYYALELCSATLKHLYVTERNDKKYDGPIPSVEEIIIQLAAGLECIHNNNLVHRDIKPGNVLIWVGDTNTNPSQQIVIKLADFGLCKQTKETGSFSMSGIKGTRDWSAPELLKVYDEEHRDKSSLPRGTIQSDIFSEGLVFAYVLLQGKHLYGNGTNVVRNLLNNQPVNLNEIPEKYQDLKEQVIIKMLETDPAKRLKAGEVVESLQKLFNSAR